MRPITEIRIEDFGNRNPKHGPSEAELGEFQEAIGAKVPSAYVDLLHHRNGGTPVHNIVIPDSEDLKPYISFAGFFCLTSNKEHGNGVWRTYRAMKNILPDKCFAFGEDEGGGLFLLRLYDGEWSVWFANMDQDFEMSLVAHSFENFIDSLLPYSDLPKVDPLFEVGEDGRPRLRK
jgi:hypothetical protein